MTLKSGVKISIFKGALLLLYSWLFKIIYHSEFVRSKYNAAKTYIPYVFSSRLILKKISVITILMIVATVNIKIALETGYILYALSFLWYELRYGQVTNSNLFFCEFELLCLTINAFRDHSFSMFTRVRIMG